MRVPFSQVFDTTGGRISPRVPVRIGTATIGPGASLAASGVLVSGVDLGSLIGHDLEVEQDASGVVTIKGHY